MWAAGSDAGSAPPDSSFESSTADLTDITSDRSLLIGLSPDRPNVPTAEDNLMADLVAKVKKPSAKSEYLDDYVMTDREKQIGENERSNLLPKEKLNNADDTTDDSTIQSDLDSSIKDESDFSTEDTKGDKMVSKQNPQNDELEGFPSTVNVLTAPNGAKVYIVGTAHFSEDSQNDVSIVIQKVQPHIVMVELCPQRINILQLDEKTILEELENINLQKIKTIIQQNGVINGLIYLLLLNLSAHLTKELGLAPGGEFRRALHEAKKIHQCLVHLGDRPIQITLHRALSALTWAQTIKLIWRLLIFKEPITKEDVESCKQRELVGELIKDMGKKFPALQTVFVNERDVFLTHSLQMATEAEIINGPVRVVGVVGMGHVQGILENWGKVRQNAIVPLMKIPPPSLSSRVLKMSCKIGFVSLLLYVGYKVVPKHWIA